MNNGLCKPQMTNIIQLSKLGAFCESRENVQLFAGLIFCDSCQENIHITNSEMFAVNDQTQQEAKATALVVGELTEPK